ncbi:hypothetical protein AVEN_221707-1 [Araneus ventricosus]|uniref:Uncharacterized protein n=1 Tax=Araneus ventricosus TaxID=182803 RepID=A0A4Y2KP20_ARAVE|nr:hypothetical protein AVEN_221707-1 [Araneus ventricosus]
MTLYKYRREKLGLSDMHLEDLHSSFRDAYKELKLTIWDDDLKWTLPSGGHFPNHPTSAYNPSFKELEMMLCVGKDNCTPTGRLQKHLRGPNSQSQPPQNA